MPPRRRMKSLAGKQRRTREWQRPIWLPGKTRRESKMSYEELSRLVGREFSNAGYGISPLQRVKRSCCFWSVTKAARRLSTSLPSIPGWRTEIFAGRQANI